MPNTLQDQLSAAVKQAEDIMAGQNATGAPSWAPEAVTAYEKAVTNARQLKKLIEEQQALDAVKTWQQAPDGQSAVANGFTAADGAVDGGAAVAGFSGAAVFPNEGNMPGVSMTGLIEETTLPDGRKSFKAGELYALDKQGEIKIKALKSGQYKDAFAAYIKNAAFHGSEWRYHMKGGAMKVLLEGQDTAGGFWTPPDIRSELVKKMASIVGIRQNAFSFTTGSNLVQFPKVVYNVGNSGDTLAKIYTSGTIPSWTAEAPAADITEATNPISGRVSIPVNTATVAVILTRALIEDSFFDILGYISQLLGESYGLFEDNAFVNGTGNGQPWGFLNHTNATIADTTVNGMYVPTGDAAKLLWEATNDPTKGILGIEAALPPQYEAGSKWYATKASYAYIRGILDGNSRPLWLPSDSYPNMPNGYMATLLGYPIVKDQFMPAVGANNYPIAFGDMTGYYIPDRVGLSVQVLNELRALRDEVVVYARKRVGGQLVQDWKLKLQKVSVS